MSKPTTRSSSSKSSHDGKTVLTPTTSSSCAATPQRSVTTPGKLELRDVMSSPKIEAAEADGKDEKEVELKQSNEQPAEGAEPTTKEAAKSSASTKAKKHVCKKHAREKRSKDAAKVAKDQASSESCSSEDAQSDSESASSSDSSSEDERQKRKQRRKEKRSKKEATLKKHKKHRRAVSSDSDSDSESSDSDASTEVGTRRSRHRKSKLAHKPQDDGYGDECVDEGLPTELDYLDQIAQLQEQVRILRLANRMKGSRMRYNDPATRMVYYDSVNRIDYYDRPNRVPYYDRPNRTGYYGIGTTANLGYGCPKETEGEAAQADQPDDPEKKPPTNRASKLEFKRVDELWDSKIHNYKLTESAEGPEDEFDQYVFTVRRRFDWENKYRNTVVDIKSKPLREALAEVMMDVKSVSLVEEQPRIDPNMLFLYLEELRTYTKKTLKARVKKEKKSKQKKWLNQMVAHCKVLIGYLDHDYDETKKTLYPLLEAGNITFDLLWALFKPNTIAYTTTYGSVEDPRCFKVDYANKETSFIRGEWYCIEGRYLEYDGKNYGLGDFEIHVEAFQGPRKITSLATYPLEYHKDPEGLKKQLIERGKKFVAMQGMNYRFHKGLAFVKKKKTVAKVNINGRIMIDPAIFRRINPNYQIAMVKPKESDILIIGDEQCSCCSSCDESDTPEESAPHEEKEKEEEPKERKGYKVFKDRNDQLHGEEVPIDSDGDEIKPEKLDKLPAMAEAQDFTNEELLIASSVVLGFAFSEKLWLEFSLSGVTDIEWNEGAFESLVLPPNQKSIVKALVSSHKFHAAETIDDVVQGKGKGLVFVLHGPPGVGKTLTGEGIAEFLKCPLYAVSAGELGTDTRYLEHELQKIMDIAHSWGAVLLLDEADVFLEKREVHDYHRNALVSIFLRLLEYFQGILFLTTNRVETFDDAFQSRIHVALKYDTLSNKAKKEIWKMFLDKVRVMEGVETMPFKESDYDALARRDLNGRQIKNAVRTAQALAVNERQKLSLEHIKQVLDVAESFQNDFRGGPGYTEAMRSYT